MKFTCPSAVLAAAVHTVIRATAARSSLLTLEGVLIDAQQDRVVLTGTDLRLSIQTTIEAEVEQPGRIVVPGRLLADYTRKLPDMPARVETLDNSVIISATGTRTRLQCMEGEDFPEMPAIEGAQSIGLPAETLKTLIHRSTFAAAVDESRPILTGVLFEAGAGRCRMVALDGYRVAICTAPYDGQAEPVRAVVPASTLSRLSGLLDAQELVHLQISRSYLGITLGDTRIVSRLLEGEFIQYEQILPKEFSTFVVIAREALSDALDRAAMLAREGKNNLIKFNIEPDTLTITSNSEAGEIREEIPIDCTGKPMEIAFNARYLTDMLKGVGDEAELAMNFTTNVSPCIIRPRESEDFLYLVLPVRIYNN